MTDDSALQRLANLVSQAAQALRVLGEQPLAIASASNKFNDAWYDDFWCAVQLGQYRWEQSQFFGSDGSEGKMEERSTNLLIPDNYGCAYNSAEKINCARRLLDELDKAGWHDLAELAIGLRTTGAILALVIQFDQIWLHCSDPQDGDDQILALIDGKLELAERRLDDRFDERVGKVELIRLDRPERNVLDHVSYQARSQFDEQIYNLKASQTLARSLIRLGRKIDKVLTSEEGCPRVLATRIRTTSGVKYNRFAREFSLDNRGIIIGKTYYDRNFLSTNENKEMFRDMRLEIERLPFIEIADLLQQADQEKIRDLFEHATSVETFDSSDLIFFVVEGASFLGFRSHLFGTDLCGIKYLNASVPGHGPLGPDTSEWLAKLPAIFRTPDTVRYL